MNKIENTIIYSYKSAISRIIINDPNSYNALSTKTLKSLIKIFKSLNNDDKTKVIIIEGYGKGFSAGHDLKEIRTLKKKSKYNKLFNLCSKLMLEIVEGRKPVIAKVHGAAFAAGGATAGGLLLPLEPLLLSSLLLSPDPDFDEDSSSSTIGASSSYMGCGG